MREVGDDIHEWVHGKCYVAALELHRLTGWKLGGLTAIRNVHRGAQMAHAWVVDPEGRAWDAAGPLEMGDVYEAFIDRLPKKPDDIRIETFTDEAELCDRLRQLEGDWWPECEEWLQKVAPTAREAMIGRVLPRWPELAEAAALRELEPEQLAF